MDVPGYMCNTWRRKIWGRLKEACVINKHACASRHERACRLLSKLRAIIVETTWAVLLVKRYCWRWNHYSFISSIRPRIPLHFAVRERHATVTEQLLQLAAISTFRRRACSPCSTLRPKTGTRTSWLHRLLFCLDLAIPGNRLVVKFKNLRLLVSSWTQDVPRHINATTDERKIMSEKWDARLIFIENYEGNIRDSGRL